MQVLTRQWSYHEEADGKIETALSNLRDWINKNSIGYNPKIAASNQKTNPARAVVFWCNKPASGVSKKGPTIERETYTTFGNYENDLYKPVCKYLNGLSAAQSALVSITYTNMSGKNATMSVWYPQKQKKKI